MTRAASQADAFTTALRHEGAQPVSVPVLTFEAPRDPRPLEESLRALASGTYGAVLFTSQNAVTAVFSTLGRLGLDARAFSASKVCAVGPATASALSSFGVTADRVAREQVGEGLLAEVLALFPGPGDRPRLLLPRAETAREALPARLAAAGFELDVVTAYVTRPVAPELARSLVEELERGEVDAITFTSSSTVRSLFDALAAVAGEARARAALGHAVLASIGPLTTATAEGLGLGVRVTASVHTAEGLLEALRGHFAPQVPRSDG